MLTSYSNYINFFYPFLPTYRILPITKKKFRIFLIFNFIPHREFRAIVYSNIFFYFLFFFINNHFIWFRFVSKEESRELNEGRGWNKKGRRVFARQNEYFTGRYVRLRFSSRKSFHGIDRSNGHATVKPINLQIRCKMNYWSRFH